MTRDELYTLAESWFQKQQWNPFPFQKKSWKAFLQGKNGLLNAPTGSGKTYALWFPIVLNYIKENPAYRTRHKKGLKAIWITPLRALSQEIKQSAERITADLGTQMTVGIRSGDTSAKERAQQKKQVPDLLITTPESLHLLLATKGHAQIFRDCSAIVVDEWHELLGTKRGVQVELGLSRLKTMAKELRIWGISATIGNLEQAREVLLGPGTKALENSVMIKARIRKKITVKSIIPKEMETFPMAGALGYPLAGGNRAHHQQQQNHPSVYQYPEPVRDLVPENLGKASRICGGDRDAPWQHQQANAPVGGTGHPQRELKGSGLYLKLGPGRRFCGPWRPLSKSGAPRASHGFYNVREEAGHRPGKESVIHFLPTHAIELVEASALQQAVKLNAVEDRIPYLNSFDVLLQYLTTLAISDGFLPWRNFPGNQTDFLLPGHLRRPMAMVAELFGAREPKPSIV